MKNGIKRVIKKVKNNQKRSKTFDKDNKYKINLKKIKKSLGSLYNSPTRKIKNKNYYEEHVYENFENKSVRENRLLKSENMKNFTSSSSSHNSNSNSNSKSNSESDIKNENKFKSKEIKIKIKESGHEKVNNKEKAKKVKLDLKKKKIKCNIFENNKKDEINEIEYNFSNFNSNLIKREKLQLEIYYNVCFSIYRNELFEINFNPFKQEIKGKLNKKKYKSSDDLLNFVKILELNKINDNIDDYSFDNEYINQNCRSNYFSENENLNYIEKISILNNKNNENIISQIDNIDSYSILKDKFKLFLFYYDK